MRVSKVLISVFTLLMTPALGWGHSLLPSGPQNFSTLKAELSKEDLREIKVGLSLFSKPWVQAPSSTKRRDGLGPHFSAVSCLSCHPALGRGAPPGVLHSGDPALIYKAASAELIEKFGDQITTRALPGLMPEATLEQLQDPGLKVSPRIAPHIAGLGYLEKLPLPNGQLGRFGWKADKLDLRHQVAAAFSGDMGITNPLYPHQVCQKFDIECWEFFDGGDEEGTEIREDHFEMVVKMVASIEPPSPLVESPHKLQGFKTFQKIGCQSCHQPQYIVEGKNIFPYTDLKLHDMGDELADHSDLSNARYWRTPPLWGLGSQKIVNGHLRLLHDGRADGIEEAISFHGGEAEPSRKKFLKLTKNQKEELVQFLSNL